MRWMEGYWKFPREIINSEQWRGNVWVSRVWIWLHSVARWGTDSSETSEGLPIGPGEVITSYRELADAVEFRMGKGEKSFHPDDRALRWAISTLKKRGEITLIRSTKASQRGLHILLNHWDETQNSTGERRSEHDQNDLERKPKRQDNKKVVPVESTTSSSRAEEDSSSMVQSLYQRSEHLFEDFLGSKLSDVDKKRLSQKIQMLVTVQGPDVLGECSEKELQKYIEWIFTEYDDPQFGNISSAKNLEQYLATKSRPRRKSKTARGNQGEVQSGGKRKKNTEEFAAEPITL
ncbi:hypothetical protein ACFL39_00070 [Gemmatimonadota bacterium]